MHVANNISPTYEAYLYSVRDAASYHHFTNWADKNDSWQKIKIITMMSITPGEDSGALTTTSPSLDGLAAGEKVEMMYLVDSSSGDQEMDHPSLWALCQEKKLHPTPGWDTFFSHVWEVGSSTISVCAPLQWDTLEMV